MLIVPTNTLLAFLEGFALILSPCILPILPLILATSIVGNKTRPFLIIAGFIISFTFFALLSRKILAISGIQQDTLQYIAYGLLFLFGLILVIPYLDDYFARMTNKLANSAENLSSGKRSQGILGALFIGLLIGVIWTPCAGPILAAALIQVISAKTNIDATLTIIAFGIGTAIPMLIIALFSQQLTQRIRVISKHAVFIRRLMGIIIIIFALLGLFKFNLAAWVVTPAQADEVQSTYPTAPEITGITKWFNSKPLTQADLKNKVVLVDFWTYSCINCIRTFPHLENWYKKYKDQGLVIIGVHSPEFPFESDPNNVANAVKEFKITYPVAMDNNYVTWNNFNNRYWPAHYLINRDGKLVDSHFGEGDYDETENKIRELLGLAKTSYFETEAPTTTMTQTPETYLGHKRAENFSSPEAVIADQAKNYSFPKKLDRNHWALKGSWTIKDDYIIAEQPNASLMIYFTAKNVYLVLGTQHNRPITATLKLNGTPIDAVTVSHHKLYTLVSQSSAKNGILEINSNASGLEAYAFTFGN